jgi:hypothetical protein
LANALLPDNIIEDARNTNAIIMIAVFAGMASAPIKGNMNAVGIFVMSTLLMYFLWSDFTPSHISYVVLWDCEPPKRRMFEYYRSTEKILEEMEQAELERQERSEGWEGEAILRCHVKKCDRDCDRGVQCVVLAKRPKYSAEERNRESNVYTDDISGDGD